MKTLKNIFVSKETKKSMSCFYKKLDLNELSMIKGREGEPHTDTYWPPVNP